MFSGPNDSFEVTAKGNASDAKKVDYLILCIQAKQGEIEDLKLEIESMKLKMHIIHREHEDKIRAFERSYSTLLSRAVIPPPFVPPKKKRRWRLW